MIGVPPSEPPVLTRLGKFDILRLLAQGSMGDVYVGRDPILGREVAIKVIQSSAAVGPEARARFAREARAAGALNHPNIVTVHEMGEEQGVLYLAMELVKGEDLGTLLQAGTLSPRDILEVLAQVCDGLAVAHRHHVFHRDVKPSNIRVLWDGQSLQAKVLDFGVAKVFNTDTTDEGTVFGTVNYMAPEYVQSGRADARSDLFAVGVILHEALSGTLPFDGPSPGTVIYRLLHEAPPPLPPTAFRGISRDAQALVRQALSKDPAGRFQSAEALAAALRAAKDPAWKWDRDRPTGGWQASASGLREPLPAEGSRGAPPGPVERRTRLRGEAATAARAEVRAEVLETTRRQLVQALALDPANARTHAMLLVTHYQLRDLDAVMQALRQARDRGLSAGSLRATPRCAQVVEEERRAPRLPPPLHREFMAYLGT